MARRGRPPKGPSSGNGDARTLTKDEELGLALEVARAYYLDDESKVAIADKLGLTRFQAARLLTVARESGMVHIDVRAPGGIDRELSALVQTELGISRALVVSSLPRVSPLDDLGYQLARTLTELCSSGNLVGLAWSRATIALTQQLMDLPRCDFVQLGGHVEGVDGMPGTGELVRRAAETSGGRAYPIYAPLVVSDAQTARALRQQPTIRSTVDRFAELHVAVASVGAWRSSGSTVFDAMPEALRLEAASRGVVGEISGRLFDEAGDPVPDLIDDCIVGINLDELSRVPQVIVTSYGDYRAAATRAAARTGLIDTLITDRSLAKALLST